MKKAKKQTDEMRAEYRRKDLGPLERGKYAAAYKNGERGVTHVTPADENIFADLGFPPEEAAKLLQESKRIIAEKLAAKATKPALTRDFRRTIVERVVREPAFAAALRDESATRDNDLPTEPKTRSIKKRVPKGSKRTVRSKSVK